MVATGAIAWEAIQRFSMHYVAVARLHVLTRIPVDELSHGRNDANRIAGPDCGRRSAQLYISSCIAVVHCHINMRMQTFQYLEIDHVQFMLWRLFQI